VLGNIGHFDNEIDMAGLSSLKGVLRETIKPQVDKWTFRAVAPSSCFRGAPAQSRKRDRSPQFRDEQLLHQPDMGSNRNCS